MAEKKEQNIDTLPVALAEPAKAEVSAPARPQPAKQEAPNKKDKKEARFLFNAFNFFGLHWVGNSTLSLWIVYNLLPKKGPQALMEGLGRGFTPVWNLIDKAVSPVRNVFRAVFKTTPKILSELEHEERIAHSARSFVETLCMCIAGSVILFPVKILENNKEKILDKVDRWFHPGNYATDANRDEQAVKPAAQHEEKETWTNLIRARLVSLVPIFFIDNRIQQYNNIRFEKGLPNADSKEWQWGAKTFDKMSNKWRDRIVNFFSRKDVTIAKIQPLVRDRLLNTLDSPPELHVVSKQMGKIQEEMKHHYNDKPMLERLGGELKALNTELLEKYPHLKKDVERAVFSEQTRLFLKEWGLTLVYTGFLFGFGKSKTGQRFLEFCHLKKKENPHAAPADTAVTEVNAAPVTEDTARKFTDTIQPRKPLLEAPEELHTDKLLSQADTQPQVAI